MLPNCTHALPMTSDGPHFNTSSLLLTVYFTLNVGRARLKYKIAPPAVTGSLDFERIFRAQ